MSPNHVAFDRIICEQRTRLTPTHGKKKSTVGEERGPRPKAPSFDYAAPWLSRASGSGSFDMMSKEEKPVWVRSAMKEKLSRSSSA